MGTLGTCPGPPEFFFIFEGLLTGCGEIFLKTNYLIVDATARSFKH